MRVILLEGSFDLLIAMRASICIVLPSPISSLEAREKEERKERVSSLAKSEAATEKSVNQN